MLVRLVCLWATLSFLRAVRGELFCYLVCKASFLSPSMLHCVYLLSAAVP